MDLSGVRLTGANLVEADLTRAKGMRSACSSGLYATA
ncbi:MAG: pentapeptide repeat-containing protein [Ktedonobacterales bacterium]